jgi:PAS domain-containing protein
MPDSNPFAHAHLEVQSEKYVVFVDSDRRYLACSQGVCELLGYSESGILSKTIDQLSYFTSDVPTMFDRFVQEGALDGLYLLRHKDGQPISIRFRSWTFADGCLAAVWRPADTWQQMYHAALLELDPTRVTALCERALAEIEFRRVAREKDGISTDVSLRELNQAATTIRRKLLDQMDNA